ERMLEADDIAAALRSAEDALRSEERSVDADRRVLAAELSDLADRLARLTSERAALVGVLSPQALAVFDLVSRCRNGGEVAQARDGICTICHVRLRPQIFNTVRRNEQIIQCDSCQRILYFLPPASSQTEAPARPAP